MTSLCLLAFCVILTYQSQTIYSILLLVGVFFGVIGDVFLIFKSKKSFLAGMAAFLIGHLAYITAFLQYDYQGLEWLAALTGLSFAMYFVYNWIKDSLSGVLKYGVIAYMFVIAVMTALGLSLRIDGQLTLVAMGAILFALSDFFVASHRFKTPKFSDRVFGLPLYYAGQFVLAATIAVMQTGSPWLPV
nr:lysoplasmalogenase [Aliikangiella sp. G2MR2-5]